MTSPDFQDLLSMDAKDAVRAPALPVGTYSALVKESERVTSRNENKTPGIRFKLTDIEPSNDVDVEAWDAYCNSPVVDVANISLSNNDTTFWLTDKAMVMLKEFCVACGSDAEGPMSKLVSQAMHQKVLIKIEQNVARDGTAVYANIKGYAKVK